MKRIFAIFALFSLLFLFSNFVNAQTNDVVVVLDTHLGKIVIEFFPSDAPKTVDNFLKLVDDGFYDEIIFHRIISNFMIQGGDPLSKDLGSQSLWGTGDAGQNIEAEFNTIKHNRGIVSMARSADPDSASSQFFIVHADSNFLDEQYTVFGRIITQESFDTLDKIASLETGARDVPIDPEQAKILTAKVVQRSEISDLLDLGVPELVLSSTIQETETSQEAIQETETSQEAIQETETSQEAIQETETSQEAIQETETSQEGGGCLIATATFGSELAPQVQQLRELRDGTVLQTKSGTAFMKQFNQLYYSFSPTIADWERENLAFKELVKVAITPLLATLSILNYVDIDSDQEMLGFGIGIIMMNVGMYIVAPAMIVYRFRK